MPPKTSVIGSMLSPPFVSNVTVTVSPNATLSPFTNLTRYKRSFKSTTSSSVTSAAIRLIVTVLSSARYLANNSISVEFIRPSSFTSPNTICEPSVEAEGIVSLYAPYSSANAETGMAHTAISCANTNTIAKSDVKILLFFICFTSDFCFHLLLAINLSDFARYLRIIEY